MESLLSRIIWQTHLQDFHPVIMGNLFSGIFSRLFGSKELKILILGLDGAGKTTILYRMQVGEVVTTIPTIGFNVETVTYKNLKFQVWDLGGQTSIRPYWRCYYSNTDAIIYVVDSKDKERISISKQELVGMLEEEELKNACLVVFANKQNIEGAMSVTEIANELGLAALKNRKWQTLCGKRPYVVYYYIAAMPPPYRLGRDTAEFGEAERRGRSLGGCGHAFHINGHAFHR